MFLMGVNPLQRKVVGAGLDPGNRDIFGPGEMASSRERHLGATCTSNGFACIKSFMYIVHCTLYGLVHCTRPYESEVHKYFMYMSFQGTMLGFGGE
jgi:hypothetical protein